MGPSRLRPCQLDGLGSRSQLAAHVQVERPELRQELIMKDDFPLFRGGPVQQSQVPMTIFWIFPP